MKTVFLSCVIVLIHLRPSGPELVTSKDADTPNEALIKQANVTSSTTVSPPPVFRPPALIRLPCTCQTGVCACCTGYILDRFNQKACFNFTIEPEDFAFTATVSFNDRVLYRNTFSGKNPEPLCIRIPRLEFIRLCMRFSNVYFENRNIHLCIDMTANWEYVTLLKWSFDCLRMGASGFAVVRPEEDGGVPVSPLDVIDQTDEDYDDAARTDQFPLQKFLPLRSHHRSTLILDSQLRNLAKMVPSKFLVDVRMLPNGDYFITENDKIHSNVVHVVKSQEGSEA